MKTRKRQVDAWITPREGAELVLGHAEYPRSKRVLYNMQKRVQEACRIYDNKIGGPEYSDYFGLRCERRPNGRLEMKVSELERWAERRRIRGLVVANV